MLDISSGQKELGSEVDHPFESTVEACRCYEGFVATSLAIVADGRVTKQEVGPVQSQVLEPLISLPSFAARLDHASCQLIAVLAAYDLDLQRYWRLPFVLVA